MRFFRNREVRRQGILSGGIVLVMAAAARGISGEAAAAVLMTGSALMAVFLFYTWRRYETIRKLSESLDEILHTGNTIELRHFREGDLEILRDEIGKLLLRMERQSQLLKEDREQLAEALADISHQIRTPLTSLGLMAERLRSREGQDAAQRSVLREMTGQIGRISWLVDTLLKLSRLDAGVMTLQMERFLAADMVKEAIRPFEVSAELHDQKICVSGGEKMEIQGDRAWTMEALQNVVKNGLEHTPDGGMLRIEMQETALYGQIAVVDSGEGIAPEDMPHLFERFYKGKHAKKDSFGIGLALARAILAEENAVIFAENSPGAGGRIVLRFYGKEK